MAAPAEAARAAAADGVLLGGFESLGGTLQGCEFGFIQRAVGAEPLGLLRWASIAPDRLVAGLRPGFAGMGDPGTLVLGEQARPDWKAHDLVYDIRMDHTHLDRAKVSREQARRMVSRSMGFLRRKLLEDLRQAEKVLSIGCSINSPITKACGDSSERCGRTGRLGCLRSMKKASARASRSSRLWRTG